MAPSLLVFAAMDGDQNCMKGMKPYLLGGCMWL